MSLDGYIAGPGGGSDWIVMDPDMDFGELAEQFDTYLVGRRTFEVSAGAGRGSTPGMQEFVFSRTLRPGDHKNVTIVGENWREVVQSLREEPERTSGCSGAGIYFVVSSRRDLSTRSKSQSFRRYSAAALPSWPNRSRALGSR